MSGLVTLLVLVGDGQFRGESAGCCVSMLERFGAVREGDDACFIAGVEAAGEVTVILAGDAPRESDYLAELEGSWSGEAGDHWRGGRLGFRFFRLGDCGFLGRRFFRFFRSGDEARYGILHGGARPIGTDDTNVTHTRGETVSGNGCGDFGADLCGDLAAWWQEDGPGYGFGEIRCDRDTANFYAGIRETVEGVVVGTGDGDLSSGLEAGGVNVADGRFWKRAAVVTAAGGQNEQ